VDVFVQLYQQRQQLKAQNARLERALQLNEAMIAVLTHDLRTPLSAITLCADRIKVEVGDGPLARTAHHVESSARRMARMIDQLLDFSRIRSGVVRLDLANHDLGALAETVAEETRQAHPSRAIEVSIHGEALGYFDSTRMAQVLSNLLGNAVQYALGSTPIVLDVDGSDTAVLHLSVRNAGVLPANLVQRIFEPFKGSFHQSRGLGLGLYIVDQFVRAHGGAVVARNVEDGVEFRVTVPRHAVR
jgi:two-component system, sensor histidine kinase and response regulator